MRDPSLRLSSLLTNGSYCTVYAASRSPSRSTIAVKVYDREQCRHSADLTLRVLREKHALELTSKLPHPFLTKHLFSHMDDIGLYIGLEQVGGGDLLTVLQMHGRLSVPQTHCYAAEVCLALGHLHSLDIVYRNLKPENVLIDLDGHAKLGDFGACVRLLGREGDVPPPAGSMSLRGHPEFQAPEIFLQGECDETTDWWAFGLLLCEMLAGSTPFARAGREVADLLAMIVDDPIVLPIDLPEAERAIIFALLVREPEERLGARPGGHMAVLAHPWFAELSAEEVLRKRVTPPWLPFRAAPPTQPAEGDSAVYNHARGASIAAAHTVDADQQLVTPTAFADWGVQSSDAPFLCFRTSEAPDDEDAPSGGFVVDDSPVSILSGTSTLSLAPSVLSCEAQPDNARLAHQRRHNDCIGAFDSLSGNRRR